MPPLLGALRRIVCNKLTTTLSTGPLVMAEALGPRRDSGAVVPAAPGRDPRLVATKKKGCKKSKCFHWKGGKCRCGRD